MLLKACLVMMLVACSAMAGDVKPYAEALHTGGSWADESWSHLSGTLTVNGYVSMSPTYQLKIDFDMVTAADDMDSPVKFTYKGVTKKLTMEQLRDLVFHVEPHVVVHETHCSMVPPSKMCPINCDTCEGTP